MTPCACNGRTVCPGFRQQMAAVLRIPSASLRESAEARIRAQHGRTKKESR